MPTLEIKRAVAAGQKERMEFPCSINPDCTSIGFATVRIFEAPKHSAVTIENGTGFTNFPQNNLRYNPTNAGQTAWSSIMSRNLGTRDRTQ